MMHTGRGKEFVDNWPHVSDDLSVSQLGRFWKLFITLQSKWDDTLCVTDYSGAHEFAIVFEH